MITGKILKLFTNCSRGILAEFGDFSAVLPMVPVLKNIVRMGFIVGFWKKMYSRYIVHYIVNGKEGLLHIILARLGTLNLVSQSVDENAKLLSMDCKLFI